MTTLEKSWGIWQTGNYGVEVHQVRNLLLAHSVMSNGFNEIGDISWVFDLQSMIGEIYFYNSEQHTQVIRSKLKLSVKDKRTIVLNYKCPEGCLHKVELRNENL